jgi:hypothetical protein
MNLPYRLSAISLITGSIIFTSCQKNQFIAEDSPNNELLRASENKSCAVTDFRCIYNITPTPQEEIIYSRTYHANGKLKNITAAVYSGGGIVGSSTYEVNWKKNRVALIHAGTADTLLVADLNKSGRVITTRDGNRPDFQYLPTSFNYTNDRVNVMKIHFSGTDLLANFHYNNGNITRIDDIGDGSTTPGKIEYQYATGNKIKQQQYFDEPRKFSWNTFTLLQFLGLFPELDGENLRTRTTVDWGNNYIAYDKVLVNHQVDQNGRLMQYAVTDPANGEISSRYFLNWNCSTAANNVEEN